MSIKNMWWADMLLVKTNGKVPIERYKNKANLKTIRERYYRGERFKSGALVTGSEQNFIPKEFVEYQLENCYPFCIDVDVHNQTEEEALKEFKKLGLPDTFTVRTPSGGYHFWYASKKPPKTSSSKIAFGVDFKSEHSICTCPMSYRDDKQYIVVKDVPLAYVEIDDNMLIPKKELIREIRNYDSQFFIETISKKIKEDTSIMKGNRHNKCVSWGGWCKANTEATLEDIEDALYVFVSHYEMPEREYKTIIKSLDKY